MSLRFLLASLPLVFLAPLAPAQQDAPAVDAATILRELDRIEQQQQLTIQSARQAAVFQLKSAAATGPTSVDLFEKAIEATQFEGKRDKPAAFVDWKASNSEMLRSKEMQTLVQLHLKYLVLSLERKGADKPDLFVQPALAYAGELAAADALFLKQGGRSDKFNEEKERKKLQSARDKEDQPVLQKVIAAKKELLDKPITEGVFTKWLRLGPWLPKADDWELVAGNLSGILEKDVRPYLRKTKNPQLMNTWEFEMKVLADRVTFGRLEHEADEFNTITRPRMQLSRANDMVELGQNNRGVIEIYALVKTYPQHPDFKKWVQRLRELLKPAAGANAAAAPAAMPGDTSPQ